MITCKHRFPGGFLTLCGMASVLIAGQALDVPLRGQDLPQFAMVNGQGDQVEALAEYQKELKANPRSSLANYRIAEVLFNQHNNQSSAYACRFALRGDGDPSWTKVWSHIQLGKIFDVTGQRDRAVREYQFAVQTNDNSWGALDEARQLLREPYQLPETR